MKDFNNLDHNLPSKNSYKRSVPGYVRHYPPAVREWNNSVYTFNKNNYIQSTTIYNTLDKLVKSYLNLGNNIGLARSKRMRYLRRKSSSRKLFVSRPEVKQTNDKVVVTAYYFDKIKNNFMRKLIFFNRAKAARRLNLKKLKRGQNHWSYKRLIIRLERRMRYSGIKQIREIKLFKERNKYKNKYTEQHLLLYFLSYFLNLLNISVFSPIAPYQSLTNEKDSKKFSLTNHDILEQTLDIQTARIHNIIKKNPNSILWINYLDQTLETIDKHNINYEYLDNKLQDFHKGVLSGYSVTNKPGDKTRQALTMYMKNRLTSLSATRFIVEINNKLNLIIKAYLKVNNVSYNVFQKMFNYLSLKLNKSITKKMFKIRGDRVSKLISSVNNNVTRTKKLLPGLKMLIDSLFNKKTELNLVNLKYFYLNSDIFTQAVITKIRKRLSPARILDSALGKATMFSRHNIKNKLTLNSLHEIYKHDNLPLLNFPPENLSSNSQKVDWVQDIFNRLFPYSFMYKYFNLSGKWRRNKITSVLTSIKYKKLWGIRIEAKGRLTRRNTAARSAFHLAYRGNLKDINKYWDKEKNFIFDMPTLLLGNSKKANTQYTFGKSKKRIGAFGIKTWISAK